MCLWLKECKPFSYKPRYFFPCVKLIDIYIETKEKKVVGAGTEQAMTLFERYIQMFHLNCTFVLTSWTEVYLNYKTLAKQLVWEHSNPMQWNTMLRHIKMWIWDQVRLWSLCEKIWTIMGVEISEKERNSSVLEVTLGNVQTLLNLTSQFRRKKMKHPFIRYVLQWHQEFQQ